MPFSKRDRHFLETVARLAYENPFLQERISLEKSALGRDFTAAGPVWSSSVEDPDAVPPNVAAIYTRLVDAV